jgi:hypothetical protein
MGLPEKETISHQNVKVYFQQKAQIEKTFQ